MERGDGVISCGKCVCEEDCCEAGECLVAMRAVKVALPPGHKSLNGHDRIDSPAQASEPPPPRTQPAAGDSHPCECKLFSDPCGSIATGGVKVFLWPAEHLQRRYGKRSLLEFIMDVRCCDGCFSALICPQDVITDKLWTLMSKVAQQRNNGMLPQRHLTTIEHVPFDNPEYVALIKSYEKNPQPGRGLPLIQGAGDGQTTT